MSPLPQCAASADGAVLLRIKVQPRARANEIQGVQGGELRIRVTAPPVDSSANQAVIRLLAKVFGISKSRIQIVRGQTSRHKTLRLEGVKLEAIADELEAWL